MTVLTEAALLKFLYLLEGKINATLEANRNAEVISVPRSLLSDAAPAVRLAYSLLTDEQELERAAEKLGWVRLPDTEQNAVDAAFWLIKEAQRLKKLENGL
jgi:hypothetical protein